MIYRPVRERNPDSIIKNVNRALKLTGFEEISLQSLSSGDYSCITPLIKELIDMQSDNKIAVSLPSLRIDSLDSAWFEQIKRVRKTGFTMAPEVGNDKLRRIINKSLINRDILNTAYEVYGAGWNLIKLYFMIGLPGEEEQDIKDIPKLVRPIGSFLQTVGVAIPNNRLIPFADAIGEVGATNIRAISSMTLQKPWEPWDGRFPLHELFELDNIRWVSISTKDIDKEITKALEQKRSIVNQQLPIDNTLPDGKSSRKSP